MNHVLSCARPWVALAAVLQIAASQSALAQPPDILRDYRLIPSHSHVHVTEGFAGVDWRLEAKGTFGLATGYGSDVDLPLPVLRPYARFVDVEGILYNPLSMAPMPVPGWDLDDTLNLEGLHGRFQTTEPNRLHFEGVDGQGVPIKLQARMHGRLIRIVGYNNPHCDGCADFFGYKVDLLAHLRPHGDVNSDGAIDATDFVLLRKTGGTAEAYGAWQEEFGADIGALAAELYADGELSAMSSAVPEPASVVMILLAAAILIGRGRAVR